MLCLRTTTGMKAWQADGIQISNIQWRKKRRKYFMIVLVDGAGEDTEQCEDTDSCICALVYLSWQQLAYRTWREEAKQQMASERIFLQPALTNHTHIDKPKRTAGLKTMKNCLPRWLGTWQAKRMLQEHQQNGERRRCLGSDALLKGSADEFNSATAELMCTVILVPYSHTYTARQGAFGLLSTFQKSHLIKRRSWHGFIHTDTSRVQFRECTRTVWVSTDCACTTSLTPPSLI